MRVGLLGGSFDPVHYGHLRAAQWALEAFELAEVRLVPARQSPFKGPCFASPEHRLTLLNLATHDHESLRVENCELDRDPPSYMVDTLRTLTQRTPGTHFTLIVGSDAALRIEKWHEISEVRRMAEIRILVRPGDGGAGEPGAADAFHGLTVSSTQIRDAIKRGKSIRYLTPESVRLYIEEKGLYQ